MAKHLPFFLLSLSLLLLSFCIRLVLVDKPPSLSCKENQFPCLDGSRCIPSIYLCDGDTDCDGNSDEFLCDNCTADHLFACRAGSRCIPRSWLCNGNGNIIPTIYVQISTILSAKINSRLESCSEQKSQECTGGCFDGKGIGTVLRCISTFGGLKLKLSFQRENHPVQSRGSAFDLCFS